MADPKGYSLRAHCAHAKDSTTAVYGLKGMRRDIVGFLEVQLLHFFSNSGHVTIEKKSGKI